MPKHVRRRPLRLSKIHPNSSLAAFLVRLRTNGIVSQDLDTLSDLFAIGFGRRAFVRALAATTSAWEEFTTTCLARWNPSCGVDDAVGPWLHKRQLDVPWFREWARSALVIVGRQKELADKAAEFPAKSGKRGQRELLDHILDVERCGPQPNYEYVLDLLGDGDVFDEWRLFESPPNPLVETSTQFQSRMKESWQLRVDAIHGSPVLKRKLDEHAEWTARFHVGRQPPFRIAARLGIDNRDTVPKGIESFARLVELPLRKKPPRSFEN